MRLKLDENLPESIAPLLAEQGHDVMTVRQQGMQGSSDVRLAQVCRREERVILTLDVGLANIQVFPPESTAGVILLRAARQSRRNVHAIVTRLLPLLKERDPRRQLWVVDERAVRIHEAQ